MSVDKIGMQGANPCLNFIAISRGDRMAVIQFDKIYKDLMCDDAPKAEPKKIPVDPWDGEKPHAENGFVEKYCL